MFRNWLKPATAVFALALSATTLGCSDTMLPSETRPAQIGNTVAPGTSLGYVDGWSSTTKDSRQLLKKLEEEKQRIKVTQEASKPLYDALKRDWDTFLKASFAKDGSAFLMCEPMQYAADTKIIGPEGGEIAAGPHKLSIPRGALTQHTVITVEVPVDTKVGVKMSPHGLQFVALPSLALGYKHCSVPVDYPYSVVYIDGENNILEWPASSVKNKTAFAWIHHFSAYVLASGRAQMR